MTSLQLSDDEIAALSARERHQLIWRLSRVEIPGLPAPGAIRSMRRRRLALMLTAVAVLIPWTIYLGFTLPDRHVAGNWTLTWVGFDVVLLLVFAATAVFGLLRRQLVVFGAFASGVLLVSDAWFDVTTADAHELPVAVATAVLFELPLAAVLIGSAFRLTRLMAARLFLSQPSDHIWTLRLPIAERAEGDDCREDPV
jgi:hypothetical protein